MSTRSRTRSRRLSLGALLVAAALLLAGCAIPLPAVEADAAPDGPQPALDEPRLENVLAAVSETLAAGDAAQDPALLDPRVYGPALQTRTAEYRLAAATAGTENATALQPIVTEPQTVVVSNDETWPKTIFVVTTIGEGLNTPLLVGLQQNSPREQYRMFAWVRLLPDTTTPATAISAEGTPSVAPAAEGLVLSPEQTLAAYADVLTNDTASQSAATFGPDYFHSAVLADRTVIQDSVSEAGSYAETFSVVDFAPISLATADGGAIVIGSLRSDQRYELTEEGGELTVSTPQVLALEGVTDPIDVTGALTATYFVTVAFYVPPAADGATIQLLGAERVLDDVTTE